MPGSFPRDRPWNPAPLAGRGSTTPGNRGISAGDHPRCYVSNFLETGLILRCAGNVGNPFQTKQGNRPSCREQEGRRCSDEVVREPRQGKAGGGARVTASVAPDPAESRGAPPTPQDPSPLRGTLGSSLRSPAEGEGTIRSDQISRSVVSDSLRPHESQHARPPCPGALTATKRTGIPAPRELAVTVSPWPWPP